MVKKIISSLNAFGLFTTLQIFLFPCINMGLFKINKKSYRSAVRHFVKKAISKTVEKYKNKSSYDESYISDISPIWFCWWQGEKNMPDIARLCYKELEKNKGSHSIIFICKDNYQKYVQLPAIFEERLRLNQISITHFTDVLRFALLREHGGIWLDSAILVLNPLKLKNLSFYTNKNIPKDDLYISNYRWTGGVLASSKNVAIINFVYDSYIEYWTKYKMIIDFMLMDYIIDIAYEEIPQIKKEIDDVPFSNEDFYTLKSIFNQKCDIILIEQIKKTSNLLSLNRRLKYSIYNEEKHLTYYGYFLEK
ncbi:capsular polysaccharide synthesis protein [Intestinibacter sp.]|uniref:capsular polysaccharide synthesis protein n=1 Tax=Intestinibacter sp. TaxID=1965304 RepID=UPI002A753BCA|nr:capsular polysaccharide synthesis protein [Intestinibacter sp.]MDY2734462.1 capsular polysaccharide synthesis protein [Intestinibacter sp.]MDY6255601.1 capsular polysaccharide synthesis protein [Bacteroidales bacterium]